MAPALLWFRRNLRLADNAALIAAAECGDPIIPVYVLDELDAGGASRWWLHHSLASLDNDLQKLGAPLLLLSGPPETALARAAEQSGAGRLFFSRRYEPQARRQEEGIGTALDSQLEISACDDGYLNHPVMPLTKSQTPFRVFTPYWRAASALPEPPQPQPVPAAIRFADHELESLRLEDLDLLPSKPNWAEGFHDDWTPGEAGALRRLDALDFAARDYAELRDRPDLDITSRLSPHLHFGEVSARQVWHALHEQAAHAKSSTGAEALCRQLYWRDFSAYVLFHFPTLPEKPLRKEFEYFPWSSDEDGLRAWQRGMTGYPIVDAGMRQLWATGWMHNRVRMIVASFPGSRELTGFSIRSSMQIWRTTRQAGSGLPVAARTQRPTFEFSIPYCRARNSTLPATTCAAGYRSSRLCRISIFTTPGAQVLKLKHHAV